MANKPILDHAKADNLRKKIEENLKKKVEVNSTIYEFANDLIRMAQLVKDPRVKEVLSNPYGEAPPKGAENDWQTRLRLHIRKLIFLSRDSANLNEFQLRELHGQIETLISDDKNLTSKQKVQLKFFEMMPIKPDQISDELERIKKFLDDFYPTSKNRPSL